MRRIHSNILGATLHARHDYRDRVDLLRSRARLLRGRDRTMLTMYLENGNTCSQIARIAGVTESSVSRRIRKLVKRLMTGDYINCMKKRRELTWTEQTIARQYLLDGLSIREIASRRSLTYYRTRRIIQKIRRMTGDAAGENSPQRSQGFRIAHRQDCLSTDS